MQRGTASLTPDANGNAQIVFPVPFLVVPTVVAMNGNYVTPSPVVAVAGTATVTTSGVWVHLVNSTTGAHWLTGPVQVNWIAVGA